MTQFRAALVADPQNATIHHNLGVALCELGEGNAGLEALERAVALDPSVAQVHATIGNERMRRGDIAAAREAYRAAIAIDPALVGALFGLYQAAQILGDPAEADAAQRSALEIQRLYVEPAHREPAQRALLLLCAPGGFDANIPLDFVLGRERTVVYKYFVLGDGNDFSEPMPSFDLIIVAIAESDAAAPLLEIAAAFVERSSAPRINDPRRVERTGRESTAALLGGVPGIRVASLARIERAALLDEPERALVAAGFELPIIIRPVGSHAGHNLARIDTAQGLRDYVAALQAPAFFISEYIEYRSPDGFFRKYRAVFVEGVAYPVHLAISNAWMIHYYNALMAEHAWMRDEEARYLADVDGALGGARVALDAIARVMDIDYFGIDYTVLVDGTVLVFEADVAMLVHTGDPIDIYPYKHEYIPRIYAAFEAMIARRIATT